MYTGARVIKINSDKTVLVGCSSQACNACKVRMFCNSKNDSSFPARNCKNLDLKVGDSVELFLPPAKTVFSTALVFVLPLMFFPIGYLICKKVFAVNEIINALCGFSAMATAFCFSAVFIRKQKDSLMPVITKVEKP